MSTCNCTIRPPREESVGPVAIFYSVPANLLAPHSVLRNRSPVISRDRTGSNVGDEGFYRRRGRETCGGVINWCRLATFRTPRAHGMGGGGCWDGGAGGGGGGGGVGNARAAVSKHVPYGTWGEDGSLQTIRGWGLQGAFPGHCFFAAKMRWCSGVWISSHLSLHSWHHHTTSHQEPIRSCQWQAQLPLRHFTDLTLAEFFDTLPYSSQQLHSKFSSQWWHY